MVAFFRLTVKQYPARKMVLVQGDMTLFRWTKKKYFYDFFYSATVLSGFNMFPARLDFTKQTR